MTKPIDNDDSHNDILMVLLHSIISHLKKRVYHNPFSYEGDQHMTYGYARISTHNKNQKLDRQIYELTSEVPDLLIENIYTDEMTGTRKDRPGLLELKSKLQPGDIVYISELSRLSRSVEDLLDLVKEFDQMGVSLHSLKEKFVFDVESVYSKMILVILAAVIDLERTMIVERVKSGVELARAKGKHIGRPRTDPKKIEEALKLYDTDKFSISRISSMMGISKATFYRALEKRRTERYLASDQSTAESANTSE